MANVCAKLLHVIIIDNIVATCTSLDTTDKKYVTMQTILNKKTTLGEAACDLLSICVRDFLDKEDSRSATSH